MDFTSIPLAFVAGILSVLSPCVWPLVPVVMASAQTAGRFGPWALAIGLALSFTALGTVVSFLLLNAGLSPLFFRNGAAILLILVAIPLIVTAAGEWLSARLSRLTSGFDPISGASATTGGQFGVGVLLGIVWLPCIGPTLGAAIALASRGQDMGLAALVMFAFSVGTVGVLVIAGLLSNRALARYRPGTMASAATARRVLGIVLLVMGLAVLTGADKALERFVIEYMPDWLYAI